MRRANLAPSSNIDANKKSINQDWFNLLFIKLVPGISSGPHYIAYPFKSQL